MEILLIIIILVLLIVFFVSKTPRQKINENEKREIPSRLFYKPDLSVFIDNESKVDLTVGLFREKVISASKMNMIRFIPKMSKTDKKISLGTDNYETISEYENNFSKYIDSLNDYASALYNAGDIKSTKKVLIKCVEAGSETSTTYRLLADVLAKLGEADKLYDLIDEVECLDIFPAVKKKIIAYINNTLSISKKGGDV